MADITSQFPVSDRKNSSFDRMLASIVRGFNAYADARSRRPLIAKLEAKTDAELAAMGLQRDQIPFFVFRDLFHI